ncbi:50S ribosomal protein L3 N(5)-glutamine methyltransferase [Bordetella petrii]|uniref:50S ribosomal protein L3 N(5)-glutamine methyltransferase n=1 Tax=Bordetella petrii TaxID=94624 RepID=UPI001E49E697|nr:50S ribosomal protein L3 N(5)-glutamine methyltransferase [Bordetella petrii]MCD0502603.1 50S ribosomal protein L3 N(5)-glutamine methyltransferase [Bordetella petrii]
MPSSSRSELSTLRDLIRYGVSRLREAGVALGHGSDNAWDETVYLVLHALHLPLDTLDPFLDARVLPDERERVLDLIDRRATERLPAAYLTQEAWLCGHRFYVDPRVIVPRSPIAELLEQSLSPWVEPESVQAALDMCTGSGCLAILTALAFPDAQVDAVDVSSEALQVARRNVADYGLQDRLALHQSDLFDQLPAREYDVVVCNPPYVNSASMAALPDEYRHEPGLALAGGADGMDLVRRILAAAPRYLSAQGVLILEIGHERAHFEAAFPHLHPVWLDTEAASDQILLLTREQLAQDTTAP